MAGILYSDAAMWQRKHTIASASAPSRAVSTRLSISIILGTTFSFSDEHVPVSAPFLLSEDAMRFLEHRTNDMAMHGDYCRRLVDGALQNSTTHDGMIDVQPLDSENAGMVAIERRMEATSTRQI